MLSKVYCETDQTECWTYNLNCDRCLLDLVVCAEDCTEASSIELLANHEPVLKQLWNRYGRSFKEKGKHVIYHVLVRCSL